MIAPPNDVPIAEILDGPARIGVEIRWRVRLRDHGRCVLAQLAPEIARDESTRRRYVRDVERLVTLGKDTPVLPILALGPAPDPRVPTASPPWRLRPHVHGETLESWLEARAPAPIDEVLELGARLSEAVGALHARRFILGDLQPSDILLAANGQLRFLDVGLRRVHTLSTLTASSILLEGSCYSAPELVHSQAGDPRSDFFSIAVMLWRALTGSLPFGTEPAFLREHQRLPRLQELRPGLPPEIASGLERCLSSRLEERPQCARELVEILRGQRSGRGEPLERVRCQACGAVVRTGLQLCLACGNAVVQFSLRPTNLQEWAGDLAGLELITIRESEEELGRLRDQLELLAARPLPSLNFIVEHEQLYGKDERKRGIALPVRLFEGLPLKTAEALQDHLAEQGFSVRVRSKRHDRRRTAVLWSTFAGLLGLPIAALFLFHTHHAEFLFLPSVIFIAAGPILRLVAPGTYRGWFGSPWGLFEKPNAGPALAQLREAPVALPAADPLLKRLAALLTADAAPDVREQVGELALLVQRLVEHRRAAVREQVEIDLVT
ncbi:MAG TPA: protein kinase, partial [Polyangia bacterium]|nr:protein kinase [Polyangia bacterium]